MPTQEQPPEVDEKALDKAWEEVCCPRCGAAVVLRGAEDSVCAEGCRFPTREAK